MTNRKQHFSIKKPCYTKMLSFRSASKKIMQKPWHTNTSWKDSKSKHNPVFLIQTLHYFSYNGQCTRTQVEDFPCMIWSSPKSFIRDLQGCRNQCNIYEPTAIAKKWGYQGKSSEIYLRANIFQTACSPSPVLRPLTWNSLGILLKLNVGQSRLATGTPTWLIFPKVHVP
jgi:hypothetical protein